MQPKCERRCEGGFGTLSLPITICRGSTPPAALATLHETGLDLPFIVVSGTIGEDVAVAMMKAGAHDYLIKDNLARLAPAVEREIREAHVRQERRQAEESLRLALLAAEEANHRFHLIADQSRTIISGSGRRGIVHLCQPRVGSRLRLCAGGTDRREVLPATSIPTKDGKNSRPLCLNSWNGGNLFLTSRTRCLPGMDESSGYRPMEARFSTTGTNSWIPWFQHRHHRTQAGPGSASRRRRTLSTNLGEHGRCNLAAGCGFPPLHVCQPVRATAARIFPGRNSGAGHVGCADSGIPGYATTRLTEVLARFGTPDESVRTEVHQIDQLRKDGSIVRTEVAITLLQNQQARQ